jgi:hypothetical protein
MKLSNKILMGFFGFIFLYMTAAFTEIRLTGTPNIINDQNSIAETVDLPAITYLVLNGVEKEVNVVGSDQHLLEVRSLTGDVLKKLKYAVSGDTLTLSGFDSDDRKNFKITVFVPSAHFKAITVDSSEVNIKGLTSGLLTIDQKAGSISVSDCRIAKIELDLNATYLNISDATVDTVSAKIETSTVNIYSSLKLFQGSLKNQSWLRISDAQEIQLTKDESSSMNMHIYQ